MLKLPILFYFLTHTLLFFPFFLGVSSVEAQSRSDPGYDPPGFLDDKGFEDLSPAGPTLGFQKKARVEAQSLEGIELSEKISILRSTSFKRRYLERQWQHLNEEANDIVLLEQALLDQFGRQGFSDELGYHPYHESAGRRFQITFLLSLPISLVYAYGLVSLAKILSNDLSSAFTDTETGIFITLGLGFSGGIAYYDQRRTQAHRSFHKKNTKESLWSEKW